MKTRAWAVQASSGLIMLASISSQKEGASDNWCASTYYAHKWKYWQDCGYHVVPVEIFVTDAGRAEVGK